MNRPVIAIASMLCALSLYSSLRAEEYRVLMRAIGPDLDVAFRAIEPCGDNYDKCMDDLLAALENAKESTDALLNPDKIVPKETRRLVEEIFVSFNAVINHLRGKNKGADRWHRPTDKTEMQGLYNTLEGYPKTFDTYLKRLKIANKSHLTTPRDLTKNLIISVEGGREFIDRILKKLDHYIHEPEEPQAPGQPPVSK